MKRSKSILLVILCMIFCVSLCPRVTAEVTPQITISDVSALPGEEVTVNMSITGNPGIMAMTFSVTYDKDNFQFLKCTRGFISVPSYENYSDKGYIIFVISEGSDKTNSGNIMSLTFKIKDNAKPGKFTVTLANHNPEKYGNSLHNCFSDSEQNLIVPTVKAGSITVEETCENAGHKYGSWKILSEADCTKTGSREHTCVRCGNKEKETVPITHSFEEEWTVDKAATPKEDGIMSRHCTKCDAVTDKITFSYAEIGGDGDDSTSSDTPSAGNSSDNSSNDITSSDASNDNNASSNTSSDTATDTVTSGDGEAVTDTSADRKPTINNTVGSKNPLSEVEKLEDYKNIKENSDKETESTSSNTNGTDLKNESVDSATENTKEENLDDKQSSSSNITAVLITVICTLLSIGIVVLGALLIIRNKKS